MKPIPHLSWALPVLVILAGILWLGSTVNTPVTGDGEVAAASLAEEAPPSGSEVAEPTRAEAVQTQSASVPEGKALTETATALLQRALVRWPGAQPVGTWPGTPARDGSKRDIVILRPTDLPYAVRIEWIPAIDGKDRVVETVADHVLAQIDIGNVPADWNEQLAVAGFKVGIPVHSKGLYRIAIDPEDPLALPDAVARLASQHAIIRYAEPDYIVRSFLEPDDTFYLDGSLWGLLNTGQNGGTSGSDISAPEGWDIRTDAAEVVVGIIDTGIRTSHEDLSPNLWINPAETDDDIDNDGNGYIDDLHGINAIRLSGDPLDDQGHGSHVAGTIGADGNNGAGVTGVAWNVRLMALKFLSSSGGGAVSDAILCIGYGVDNGADILSNSWGGSAYSRALHDAVEQARDAGVLFVVAAGNASTDNDIVPVFPGSLPVDNVVTVASTDRNDALSSFSSFGQGSVDLAAPGSAILSAGIDSDDDYATLNGTSMATPHVSGALALLRAEFPGDAYGQLINRLYRGTDPLPALAEGIVATEGRLNLAGALGTVDNRPVNDDFADARFLYGDVLLLRAFNHGATSQPDEPAINGETSPNSVWFSFTPQASGLTNVRVAPAQSLFDPIRAQTITVNHDNLDPVIGVYTGESLADLTRVEAGMGDVTFTAEAGQTYRIAVAGQNGDEGLIMLEVVGPPRNSSIANAIPLILGRGTTGTNRNALPEQNEPDHAGQPATASVWYKWTANMTGRIGFSTRNSDFDTVAAVYTGPASGVTMDALVPVAKNNDAIGALFSRLDFQAISGATYYFAVDGFEGAQGKLSATLALAPANDDFADSTVISGNSARRTVSTNFATREAAEPQHLPGEGNGETIWFTWTAPANARVTLSSSGSFLPMIIAAYTGDSLATLQLVGRDGANNRPTRLTFDTVQGTTYRIAIEAWDWSLSAAPFSLDTTPVPPNEVFANAIELVGRRATITGSNAGAGREPGEPSSNYNGSGSVWYKWTAPLTGEVGIYGERLDKPRLWNIVLNVFTGEAVNALTHVEEDFGNGIGRDAFAHWNAVAGRTYYIQATSLNRDQLLGGEGPFTLDLRPLAEHAAANDNFADAIELDGSLVYNFRTHIYAASVEPGEPDHAGIDASQTLWWKFSPGEEQAGRYSVSTSQSESIIVTTIYRIPAGKDAAFANLEEVADNHASASLAFPDVAWNAVEGETYFIVLDRAGGSRGRVIFNFQKVPDNYVFAGAEVINGDSANIVAHNWGSVREPGEPSIGARATQLGSRSLWWKWTAPSSGIYQLDTIGSETPVPEDNIPHPDRTLFGFDTRLGVYVGSSVSGLTRVASNDSRTTESYGNTWMSFQRNSRLEFAATEGTTYIILVNGENTDLNGTELECQTNTGRIRLNLAKLVLPANNSFSNAKVITGTSFREITPTYGASKEAGEPRHGGITGGRSLWWKWTAPYTGKFVISTAGNLYDDYHARRTGIGVYFGSSVDSLIHVASDQNGAGLNSGENTWSSVTFTAGKGVTYHFAADANVPGNLAFILTTPPANDNFGDATEMVGSRWVATGHHLGSTTEPGEPRVDGGYISEPDNNFRSVWWKWTAPASGEISVDTLGSESLNVIGVFTGEAVDALAALTPVPKSGGNPFNGDAERRARDGNNRGPALFTAEAGTTYYISVQGSGYIVPSSGPITLTLVGPPAIPFAPDTFNAVRSGPSRIDLYWDDVALDEESYVIERSADGTDWQLLHESPPDSVSHTDFDAPDGVSWHYRIRARNSVGDSPGVVAVWKSQLDAWRYANFGTHENSGNTADAAAPFGDTVPNLLKYAFNMDASGFDDRLLDPGTGAAGLPVIYPTTRDDGRLRIEFVRRKADSFPSVQYVVEFSDSPAFNSTVPGLLITISSIDQVWERVVAEDSTNQAGPSRFARVSIRPL